MSIPGLRIVSTSDDAHRGQRRQQLQGTEMHVQMRDGKLIVMKHDRQGCGRHVRFQPKLQLSWASLLQTPLPPLKNSSDKLRPSATSIYARTFQSITKLRYPPGHSFAMRLKNVSMATATLDERPQESRDNADLNDRQHCHQELQLLNSICRRSILTSSCQ